MCVADGLSAWPTEMVSMPSSFKEIQQNQAQKYSKKGDIVMAKTRSGRHPGSDTPSTAPRWRLHTLSSTVLIYYRFFNLSPSPYRIANVSPLGGSRFDFFPFICDSKDHVANCASYTDFSAR